MDLIFLTMIVQISWHIVIWKLLGQEGQWLMTLSVLKAKWCAFVSGPRAQKGELSPVQWKGPAPFFLNEKPGSVGTSSPISWGRDWTSITLWELLRASEMRSENLFFGLQLWRQEGCSNEQLFSTLVRLVIWLSRDVVSGELSHHLEKRQLSMSILGNGMSLLNTWELGL